MSDCKKKKCCKTCPTGPTGPTGPSGGPTGPTGPVGSVCITILCGEGSPQGVVTADPGTLYSNTTGGIGVTLWVKETGVGTNTGWAAK